ncbi:MAG: hypothetical protein P8189_01275 [Anaerolineae bacterium]
MEGPRERVAVGAQFVFAEASAYRPVALAVDGGGPQILAQATVLSRHQHDIGLGETYVRPGRRSQEPPEPKAELPRLPAPDGPDLTAVITERKIYRPKEEAHIFIVAPDAPGGEVEMEVQLAGQQIGKERVHLDEAGLALRPYADLEEGEYTVLVRRGGRDQRRGQPGARCTFSVAEFTLSPLIALLEDHTYEAGALSFRLKVIALSVPYDGPAELALQSGPAASGRIVETQKATVREGAVEASFDVKKHEGPFRVQVTTPDGETASVFFPGTGRTERERITLCPLGRVAEAGLLPGEDTAEVRGLHVGYDGVEMTPLRLEGAVGRSGRLVADVRAAVVQVVTFHPLSGQVAVHEWRDVNVGDAFEFPVEAPYTLFTVGLLAPRQPYEAWGVVVHPNEAEAWLSAPERAEPGEEIAVRVEADRVGACLLLVYDARLEHESPVPKLGKQLMEVVRAGTEDLKEQTAPSLASAPPWGWGYPPYMEDGIVQFAAAPVARASTRMPMAAPGVELLRSVAQVKASGLPEAAAVDVATEVETLTFVAVPSREDFPELAYLELFPVEGAVERTVRLGDQIGTWRCRAYVVSGLDVLELTADVEAAKAVYAELDLPAIVGEGDDILAGVRYHTQQPATMTITHPDGQEISGGVMGHGAETFHLVEPGDVTVHIFSPEGEDWTTRTVQPPGVQTVTTSRLEILQQGETMRGERVVVYPGPADVLQETIEALGRYPFG